MALGEEESDYTLSFGSDLDNNPNTGWTDRSGLWRWDCVSFDRILPIVSFWDSELVMELDLNSMLD